MDTQSYTATVAQLLQWARIAERPITVFDLETTSRNPYVVWLGITELGYITFLPDGRLETRRSLVNPERRIPREVSQLTGIFDADVADQPTWAGWASTFHAMAQDHIMVGFNSQAFDCVVVQRENARYGVMGTTFAHSLDARALPDVAGTLGQAMQGLGLSVGRAHRALDDAWSTAKLIATVAARHGLAALDACVGVRPGFCHISDPAHWSTRSPRATRETAILTHYTQFGVMPDLDRLAEEYGLKRSTVEGDVYRLVQSGKIPSALLDRPDVQAYLSAQLGAAITATWTGDAVGRLKPLFTHLAPTAPDGFDYTQLRLALARHKAPRVDAA